MEDPKRTVAQFRATQSTLGATGESDAVAAEALRGVRDHKAAHASSKAAAALRGSPDQPLVAPSGETAIERRRRHNVDAMHNVGAFAYTPATDAANVLKSTYIETGGELPIFKPPPEERGSKRKVRE